MFIPFDGRVRKAEKPAIHQYALLARIEFSPRSIFGARQHEPYRIDPTHLNNEQ